MRVATDFKAGQIAGAIRWKTYDRMMGYTIRGRGYRDDYKRSNRHARRVLARSLRSARLEPEN